MAAQPDFVRDYMSTLPVNWDDVKFIDGYPGKFIVLARRNGDKWYIAGINAEKTERIFTFNVPFVNKIPNGILITDSANEKGLIKKDIDLSKPVTTKIVPNGGFVIKTL
jgi:alpha-glucosidase